MNFGAAIYKIINLPDEKRGINSSDFLNSKYNQYIKLYEEVILQIRAMKLF